MANTVAGVLLTGAHAARPASGVSAGTLYACSTHGLVYQTSDTGSTWTTWSTWQPMTTAQDVIVGGAAGLPGRLAIGAAGASLGVLNSVVAYNSGTSMPGSKATGDRYWRTDLGLEAYWDGTRWLTTQIFRESLTAGNTLAPDSTGTAEGRMPLWGTAYDLWLLNLDSVTYPATTNDGSHYWTASLNKNIANDTGSVIVTFNTSADTVNVWTARRTAINASVVAATYYNLNVTTAKTSTPGGLYFAYALEYRLILT